MKLINDKEFLDVQTRWFEKQIKNLDINNFNVSGIAEKDNKVNAILNGGSLQNKHLEQLRGLLSATGLKKLSNTIASAKKRKNSTKKSLQLMLDRNVIYELEQTAKNRGMTISELITNNNSANITDKNQYNVNTTVNTDAGVAMSCLIRHYGIDISELLERLLIGEQKKALAKIAKQYPNDEEQEKALDLFFGIED